MSERTRQEVWQQIQIAQLIDSDTVVLPISTTKLLLECARLINEGAASKPWASSSRMQKSHIAKTHLLNADELRDRCEELSRKL